MYYYGNLFTSKPNIFFALKLWKSPQSCILRNQQWLAAWDFTAWQYKPFGTIYTC